MRGSGAAREATSKCEFANCAEPAARRAVAQPSHREANEAERTRAARMGAARLSEAEAKIKKRLARLHVRASEKLAGRSLC